MPVSQIGETDTQERDLAAGAWVFGLSNGSGGLTVTNGPALVRAKITFTGFAQVYQITVRTKSTGQYATYYEDYTTGNSQVYIFTPEVLIEDDDVFNVYVRSQSSLDTATSVTAKLYDMSAFISPNDGRMLISTDAQDLKTTLTVGSYLKGILTTALTETSGYIAAAFKNFFNVETPVATAASVNQTGDSYGVVTHADYGNAQLVRSTTPANKLDVSATGEAGLDFSNIKAAAGPTTLTNITVPNVTLVGTTTTNTDMVAAAPSTADIVTAMQAAGTMLKALDDLTKAAGDGDLAAMKTIIDALPDAGALTTLQAAVDALVAGAPINIDNNGIVITNEDITP